MAPYTVAIDGELLTRWTVRLALMAYFFALAAALTARRGPGQAARLLYTIGCGLLLVHVAFAFHYYHGWSHARAAADTAQKTKNVIDVSFAAGIWFNYAFAAAWLLDVGHWWLAGEAAYRRRPRWVHAALHGFFLFIIFNATVVFETGVTRWTGLVGCLLIVGLAWWRLCRHHSKREDEGVHR